MGTKTEILAAMTSILPDLLALQGELAPQAEAYISGHCVEQLQTVRTALAGFTADNTKDELEQGILHALARMWDVGQSMENARRGEFPLNSGTANYDDYARRVKRLNTLADTLRAQQELADRNSTEYWRGGFTFAADPDLHEHP